MQGEMLNSCIPLMALNLERDSVGVVILGGISAHTEGDIVKCTGKIWKYLL